MFTLSGTNANNSQHFESPRQGTEPFTKTDHVINHPCESTLQFGTKIPNYFFQGTLRAFYFNVNVHRIESTQCNCQVEVFRPKKKKKKP